MPFRTPSLGAPEKRVLAEIRDLRDRLAIHLHEPRRWYGPLRRLSFARAIQGSNSIEGYDAVLDDAAAVAMGEDPLDAGDETRLALAGYRDAMTFVLQMAGDPEFRYSTQLLKSLHFMMAGYDMKNRPGQWRAGAIYVHDGRSGSVVYEGPDLDRVQPLMGELVARLNHDDPTPQVVRAAMAHLNLVMIHPFRDGNGRMARCLQSLVLARGGVLSPEFMSVEEYLGHNTDAYHAVLRSVGGGGWYPENDARPWLRFILTAHLRQARTMLRRVKETERLWFELERILERERLTGRTIHALFDAVQGLRVRNSTYRATLADADEQITLQTATRDLAELVNAGLLVACGRNRGRHYTAGSALTAIRKALVAARDPRDDSDPFAESR